MNSDQIYQEIKPIKKLENFIHSFWMHRNNSDTPEYKTIVPDGYFKIVFVVQEGKILNYFMTGLWVRENNFITPQIFLSFERKFSNLSKYMSNAFSEKNVS